MCTFVASRVFGRTGRSTRPCTLPKRRAEKSARKVGGERILLYADAYLRHAIFPSIVPYNPWPNFNFTGPLRPYPREAMRKVPDHIVKPDYADTSTLHAHEIGIDNDIRTKKGIPESEMEDRGNTAIVSLNAGEIKKMRRVCAMAREVLQIAGAAVKPGITTEEIDDIVFQECMKRNAYPSPLNYHGFPKSCCT